MRQFFYSFADVVFVPYAFLIKMDQSRFIAQHVVNLPKSGIRDFFDIVAQMKDAISLGVGEPDFDTPCW